MAFYYRKIEYINLKLNRIIAFNQVSQIVQFLIYL